MTVIFLTLVPIVCTEGGSMEVPDKMIQKQSSDVTDEGYHVLLLYI